MASSKEVFELRREGFLDDAYAMAVRVCSVDPYDEWNAKALAWCLYDLIKRSVAQKEVEATAKYAAHLSQIEIDEYDDVLYKAVNNILLLANPEKRIIVEAKQLSFNNREEEARPLYQKAFQQFPDDEDLVKAYGWTIYKLLKKTIENKDKVKTQNLLGEYILIESKIIDEKLRQSMEYLKEQADDEKQIIRDAKEKSQNGNHAEALRLYREAIKRFPDDKSLNEQLGWELQKEGKLIFDAEKVNVLDARKLLAEYIVLKNERPSRLHSLFLKFANKIIDSQEFNLVSFVKLWDLNNLTSEDFEPFVKDGNSYPCIAEKIIQHTSKLVLEKRMVHELEYLMPFVDKGIATFKENIWLPYYKAKLLHLVGRNEEAIEFLIPVVKEKITEYWTWSLLAELVVVDDSEKAFSCYCKSLLCKAEPKFLTKVRMKFTELLVRKELWKEAKCEINAIINSKEEGAYIPDVLIAYQQKDWFKLAEAKRTNIDFYNSNKQIAEELIFHDLPWYESSLGETFTIPERPDKPRRKLYIKLPNNIIEAVVSDRKFNTNKNYKVGESIKIKGEYDKEKIFHVYLLEKRQSQDNWDVFDWFHGNVVREIKRDDPNKIAWVIFVKMSDQMQEGIIDENSIIDQTDLKEGMPISVRYFQKKKVQLNSYRNPFQKPVNEEKIKILSISNRRDGEFWDMYPNYVGVVDHINTEKGIAHFIVNTQIDGIINLNKFDEKIKVGTKLLLKLNKIKKGNEAYHKVLSSSITDKNPSSSVLRDFHGMINISGSFGFADDVFIENSMISERGIQDDDFVSGTAILNYNKKKNSWGWKALKID